MCFNEAEAIKPRNPPRRPGRATDTTRFNEAEAIKPRNPFSEQRQGRSVVRFNEAEAIKPRNLVTLKLGSPGSRASMRPRQSSLGIGECPMPGPSRRWEASMRPRQSSLGIGCRRTCRRLGVPGFNEAEAIKPRNPVLYSVPWNSYRRFNEAEAIKPRNHRQHDVESEELHQLQ